MAFDPLPDDGHGVHAAWYAAHVLAGMDPDDVHGPTSYARRVASGTLLAWWVVEGEAPIAWAALAPRHGRYLPGAWHLYGCWVAPSHRRLGIARTLWAHRISLIPADAPVTVSIVPGKLGSEILARELGFSSVGASGPWMHYGLPSGHPSRPRV